MKEEHLLASSIVNKNGADGVITIVIDDGNISTGEYAKALLEKYPEMTVSFALITKKLAGFKLSEDGSEYLRDENGNFLLTQTAAQKNTAAFWQELLSLYPNIEFLNHSHTHAYAGEDDTSLYIAEDASGNKYLYPKGSISAEVFGVQQIIKEFLGQKSRAFILPGISGKENGWSTNSWLPLIKSGIFLGARGTSASTDASSMVMMPSDFNNDKLLWYEKAFVVRYFYMATYNDEGGNKKFYDKTISYDDAISNGIGHATDFIDSALSKGGWASFCIHDIIEEHGSGTLPIYYEQADALFSYANELRKNGDAWVTTYGNALTYYREWSKSYASAVLCKGEYIDLSLTVTEDNEMFDMPLTVKVEIPVAWERCSYTLGDKTVELTANKDEDGKSFVYADIVPGDENGKIMPLP